MVKLVKPLQPSKADLAIEVTLEGMVKLVKPLQYSKADLPIEVILEGRVKLVKPLQSEYMYIFEYQLFVVNTIEKWLGFCLKTENWVIFN